MLCSHLNLLCCHRRSQLILSHSQQHNRLFRDSTSAVKRTEIILVFSTLQNSFSPSCFKCQNYS